MPECVGVPGAMGSLVSGACSDAPDQKPVVVIVDDDAGAEEKTEERDWAYRPYPSEVASSECSSLGSAKVSTA